MPALRHGSRQSKEAKPTGALAELADGSYWHKADMLLATLNVRYWSNSGQLQTSALTG
jgi:hypothetical protein